MGIEIRAGRPRYIRKEWRDGRCSSVYVATGEAAKLHAMIADRARQKAEADRIRSREEGEALEARDREVAGVFARVERLVHAALLVAGYREHRRTWRRRRMPKRTKAEPQVPAVAAPAIPDTHEGLVALLDRAKGGDESTVPILHAMLAGSGGAEFIRLCGGDLARLAERLVMKAASGLDVAAREALRVQVEGMRLELAGPAPSSMERLLIDRVILTWIDVHTLDVQALRGRGADAAADRRDRARDRASRRHLAAIKALATVRRLALPNLQVFAARQQQVNLMPPGPPVVTVSEPVQEAGSSTPPPPSRRASRKRSASPRSGK